MSQEELDKLDSNEIESMNVIKNTNQQEIRIVTKKFNKTLTENELFINGEKVDKNKALQLDQNTIDKMDVNTNKNTIRITTKIISQSTDNVTILKSPTPPIAPTFKTKAPKAPKAPIAPKGDPIHGNKKAWKEFDNKMEEYNKKMEVFDKKMESFDAEMEAFDTEMESFDKKMQIYDQQMEEYQLKLDAKK